MGHIKETLYYFVDLNPLLGVKRPMKENILKIDFLVVIFFSFSFKENNTDFL